MHDGSVNLAARPSNYVHFVGQFNDADLGCPLSILVSDTHVLLRLQAGYSELEEAGVDSQVAEVGKFAVPEWIRLHLKCNI